MFKNTSSFLSVLPYFHIASSNFQAPSTKIKEMSSEAPAKPRRKKKTEVPVHKSTKQDERNADSTHKSYGAQFNSKRRNKHKNFDNELQACDSNFDLTENEGNVHKINKRELVSNNERLYTENQQLNQKLDENEYYFNKKLVKFKEKLNNIQKVNEDITNENGAIRSQYQELLHNFEECKVQLENSKHCGNCEQLKALLEKYSSDNNLLNDSNKQLTEDIGMLKNVVYRLNVQMERYQEKLRSYDIKTKPANINQLVNTTNNLEIVVNEAISSLPENHLDHSHVPITWGSVNSHTLGPLLDAYQETVSEKDEIIQNYELELSHFTGKLREIMTDNEELHRRLTLDDECSAKLSLELQKVKSDLKSTKEQNDLLIKKCALKQDKLEEVLRCYEQKVEQLTRDYNVVVDQYHKCRTEVATLKEKNKSLVDSQDEIKNERQNYIPISMHTSSVNECKKWYEELKYQYEQEKSKMQETVSTLNAQNKELANMTNAMKVEKDDLEFKIKTSEKHLKKAETKYLDLQHAFHEIQLSRSACRKQLHKAMNFAKDLVTEQESLLKALHQRQQENKAVKQIGSDIATRMDSLKNQLKTVQRDAWHELSTVEQRLQNQDSIILTMKREHNEEVERLKEIIKQKEQNNLLLKDENSSSIPMPHYLLLKDRNMN